MEKRLNWVDKAKLLGMILVIVAHNNTFGEIGNRLIFSFHMPLFFFLNGMFYREKSITVTLRKNFKKYIVPYIITVFACVIFQGIVRTIVFVPIGAKPHSAIDILIESLVLEYGWSLTWFLPCLFVTSMIMITLFSVIKKEELRISIVLIINVITYYYFTIPSYLELKQSLMAMIFMSGGYYFNKYYIRRNNDKLDWVIIVIMSITWGICTLLCGNSIDMKNNIYSKYPISLIGAFGAIIAIVLVIRKFENSEKFSFWGRNTLLLYVIHCVEQDFIPWSGIRSKVNSYFPGEIIGNILILGIRLIMVFGIAYGIFLIKNSKIIKGSSRVGCYCQVKANLHKFAKK